MFLKHNNKFTIQNLITTVFSEMPSFQSDDELEPLKKKTLFCAFYMMLLESLQIMLQQQNSTYNNQKTSCLNKTAIVPIAPPIAKLPTSPIKIFLLD